MSLCRVRITDQKLSLLGSPNYHDDEDTWDMPSDEYVLVSADWVKVVACPHRHWGAGVSCRFCGGTGEIETVDYDPTLLIGTT